MERRTKLLIIIVAALLLLGVGLWILFQPFIQPATPSTPPSASTTPSPKPGTTPPTTAPQVVPPSQPTGQADLKQLQDRAGAFVSRIGSGTSADGFRGYQDVLLEATPEMQTKLLAEQKALQAAHPASGPRFGLTTRVVSADARDAVAGASSITMRIQVQQAEDAGNPGSPTSVKYKLATVTFAKQAGGAYLVSGLTWEDVKL